MRGGGREERRERERERERTQTTRRNITPTGHTLLTKEALLCLLLASGMYTGLSGICFRKGPLLGERGGLMVRSVKLVGLENE